MGAESGGQNLLLSSSFHHIAKIQKILNNIILHHEQLPHHPTALADELLDELGAGHSAETFGLFSTRGADTTLPDEGALGVMGHSSGKQSLPRSRGPPFWGGSCAACSCRS